ncbi:MAG: hypothetical protein IJ157_09830 [Clostridia bacterium]|nr:hypothetical protein [Clostridia bacterium]
MKKENLLRFILIGVGGAIVIFLILIFVRPLLHAGETTTQLVKDPTNWAMAVFCGALAAWSMWRKENKKK